MEACDVLTSDNSGSSCISAIYKEHTLSTNTTRVLQILPPTDSPVSNLISVRLSIITLDPPPEYQALSYEWGEPSLTKTILVDDRPFLIRINLWTFLSQAQEEEHLGLLWIDAICINQDDLEERGRQVAMMGQIYSEATEVRVWLGIATASNSLAMQRLVETDWLGLCYCFDPELNPENSVLQQLVATTQLDHHKAQLLSVTTDEYLAPMSDLEKLTYWSRLWIVQECILARRLLFQCGSQLIDASSSYNFYTFMAVLARSVPQAQDFADASSFQQWLEPRKILKTFIHKGHRYKMWRVLSVRASNNDESEQGPEGFAHLMMIFEESQCTDFHDRVYAIRSLNKFAFDNIIPDYTKSRFQLSREIVAHFADAWESMGHRHKKIALIAARLLVVRFELANEFAAVEVLASIPNPFRDIFGSSLNGNNLF